MNRLLIMPAALVVLAGAAAVAVLAMRDGGSGGADMAAAGAGPRLWIDHPLSGSEFRLGQSVTIRWHASAAQGVRQTEVRANGERLALAEDFDHAAQIVTQRHEWTPSAPGEYLIEVTGSGADGATGAAAQKRITVVGAAPPAAGTPPASPPTSTAPAAPTSAASSTPRPGETPPPPADTPAPSATLSPPSSTPVPPTVTPMPATRTPTPLPDTTPPPAPYIISPKDNILIAPCFNSSHSLLLRWSLPADPSGIQDFRVELERKISNLQWEPVALPEPVVTQPALDVYAQVHCGDTYRWRVRARDGAGNDSVYSNWAQFGVSLG